MNLDGIRQIGKIFNCHGIKGELKVTPYTSYPDIFLELDRVILFEGQQRVHYKVLKSRPVKNYWLMVLEGVDGRTAAEALKDQDVFLEEDKLPPLAEDEFLIHEIYESKVYSTDGEYLGIITDYFDNGVHGVCEVTLDQKKFLFPTTNEILQEIVPGEKVVIQLLPNLRDLDDE